MKNKLNLLGALSLLLIPNLASAHGFSITNEEIAFFLSVFLIIFLIGYLPYVFLSLRLAKQAETTGTTTGTKVFASIFMFINTSVFLYVFFGSFVIILDGGESYTIMIFAPILIVSTLLWGFPFRAYMRGMRSNKKNTGDKSNLLDA